MVEAHLEPNSARNFPHSSGSLYKAKLLHTPKSHMGARSVLLPQIRLTSMEMVTYATTYTVVSVSVFCILSGFKKYSKVSNESQMPEHF